MQLILTPHSPLWFVGVMNNYAVRPHQYRFFARYSGKVIRAVMAHTCSLTQVFGLV